MLSKETWEAAPCTGTGVNGQDRACFFPAPPTTIDQTVVQAFSITVHDKPTCLYPGASRYGIVYGLGKHSDFYKFFMKNKHHSDKLCGQCTDGQLVCAPPDREPLGNMTYDDFTAQKNAVMDSTSDPTKCKGTTVGGYNEFDSNGLSWADSMGIVNVTSGGHAADTASPTDEALCTFLKKALPSKKVHAVFAFDGFDCKAQPSLHFQRYLTCAVDEPVADWPDVHI